VAKARRFDSVEGLNKALRSFPAESRKELSDAAGEVAQNISSKAAGAARMVGGVAGKYVAPTIRPSRGRTPRITMGGGRPKMRRGKRQRPGDVVWGAEFGGSTPWPKNRSAFYAQRPPSAQRPGGTTQFRPHRGREGYFLWPTIRAQEDASREMYADALETAMLRAR